MTQRATQEKRIFTRIIHDAPVTISRAATRCQTALLDISLKGALVERPADWQGEVGDDWMLNIELGESTLRIMMEARVAHIENGHIGFQCHHIDLDSISNLRRLVTLNLADELLLERELSALVH